MKRWVPRWGWTALVGAPLVLAMALSQALAAPNSVRIEPASAVLDAGGAADVAVIAEPPPDGLGAWVIEVHFDPHVVATTSRQCDPIDTPAGAVGAVGCQAVDSNGDGSVDTVKAFGAVLFRDTSKGLSDTSSLASISFDAIGPAAACTALVVTVVAFSDASGAESNPAAGSGELCIAGASPVTTAVAPSPPPATAPTVPAGGGNTGPAAGPLDDVSSSTPPGTSGAGVAVASSPLVSGVLSGQARAGDSPGNAATAQGTSSDRSSAIPWLLAAIGLPLAAGGVWFVARSLNGRRPT